MAETEVVPIDMPDSNGEMTGKPKLHTVFVLLYEDYLLEIAYWQMAYTVIEPFYLRLYRTQPTELLADGNDTVSHM